MQVKLWENEIPFMNEGADVPNYMTLYSVCTHTPAPCVVIYPGGGYSHRAEHEGRPIAEYLNSRGIHAVVVEYRVSPNHHPAPLADAQRAVKLVRARAKEWYIDPDKIITLGFSAGGHLAASTITLPDVDTGINDDIAKQSSLPNGAILCYPVISVIDDFGHVGSGKNLLGDKCETDGEYFSLQNRVNEKTPQVFLWHTSDDQAVNVKNSLVFGEKLRDLGIPFEMHIFPRGKHGLGMASLTTDVSKWAGLAADWIIKNI